MTSFKALIADLHHLGVLRLTGSYADGTERANSDLDFKVKEDHPDWRHQGHQRNIDEVIDVLKRHGIKWRSTETGYVSTIGVENAGLPIHLEFAERFMRRPGRLPSREIEGFTFKTY